MSFAPVWDQNAKILVLGTYPSPMSWATGFYYGHPQNRFWPLMASLFDAPRPASISEKQKLLLAHGIALWDVLQSCDIEGASDASIRNGVPNPISDILDRGKIQAVFANGSTAARLYRSYWGHKITLPFRQLPSTSPANARYRFDDLLASWRCIKEILDAS